MTNTSLDDNSCGIIQIDPNSTSLSGRECSSTTSDWNTNKIKGLSDALARIYLEKKQIFKEEKIFENKSESSFLINNIQELESSYKHLIPKFRFGMSIAANAIALNKSALQISKMLDIGTEVSIATNTIATNTMALSESMLKALKMLDNDVEMGIDKNLGEINQIDNELESDIFIQMPPIKKFTKKAKTRRITQAVPNFILEED